jgi:ketosteroid isomerase-like protein
VSETQEKNKAIVRRFLEEIVRENFDVVDELVSPDFVDLSPQAGQEPDREGFKRWLAELIAPLSDISITIDD